MIIGSEAVFNQVIAKEAFILFGADYCSSCGVFKLVLEDKLKESLNITIYYLDTVQFPELAKQQGVRSIPSLKFYKDGKIVNMLENYTKIGLDEFISKYQD